MSEPAIGGRASIPVDVKAGQTLYWCACGQSKNQPFCDGSHKGSEFSPKQWVAEKDAKVFLCTCKRTGKAPFCDGSHTKL